MVGFGTEVGAALQQHKTTLCQADPELSLYLRGKREKQEGREKREKQEGREKRKRDKVGGKKKGERGKNDNHQLYSSLTCWS